MLSLLRRSFWGPPWIMTVESLWQPALPAPGVSLLIVFPLTCSDRFPFFSRPWSHIALDFITGLPPSEGNTTILSIVDRFSKSAHLVPLTKLPSATETAQLLVHHVFRLHAIPSDVASDRGPQFTSGMWKAFCRPLGATVSLFSISKPMAKQSRPISTWNQC